MSRLGAPKNILLTGPPGCGKTSIVKDIVEKLPRVAGGFFTSEIRESGVRAGFEVASLDGRKGILAHVKHQGPRRVGKYGVDVVGFEKVGVEALRQALEKEGVIVIDEVGRMELFSRRFRELLLRALDSPLPVLGTIQARKDPFLDAIRAREDALIVRVGRRERAAVAQRVLSLIRAA